MAGSAVTTTWASADVQVSVDIAELNDLAGLAVEYVDHAVAADPGPQGADLAAELRVLRTRLVQGMRQPRGHSGIILRRGQRGAGDGPVAELFPDVPDQRDQGLFGLVAQGLRCLARNGGRDRQGN